MQNRNERSIYPLSNLILNDIIKSKLIINELEAHVNEMV
jgi:hypothetical protein